MSPDYPPPKSHNLQLRFCIVVSSREKKLLRQYCNNAYTKRAQKNHVKHRQRIETLHMMKKFQEKPQARRLKNYHRRSQTPKQRQQFQEGETGFLSFLFRPRRQCRKRDSKASHLAELSRLCSSISMKGVMAGEGRVLLFGVFFFSAAGVNR